MEIESTLSSTPPAVSVSRPRVTPLLDWLIAGYVLVVIYGSLVPFNFRADLSAARKRVPGVLRTWPLGDTRAGRRDFAVNIAFYAPLGILVAWRLVLHNRRSKLGAALFASSCAAGLALLMEMTQLLLPDRGPTIHDVLANSLGGAIGGLVGASLLAGKWGRLLTRAAAAAVGRPAGVAAILLAVFLLADAWDPFYPVLRLGELAENVRGSHASLASGLAVHPWHRWLVCRIGLYAFFTAIVGGALGGGRRSWARAAMLTIGFALATEAGKPFFGHRIAKLASPATAAVGACCGALLASAMAGRFSVRTKLFAAMFLLAFYLGYHEWKPFVFTWDPQAMAAKMADQGFGWPFHRFASSLRGTGEIHLFARIVGVTGAIACIACAQSRFLKGSWPLRAAKACLLTGGLGLVLEAGQFVIAGRYPAFVHVLHFTIGGSLGALAADYIPRGGRDPVAANPGTPGPPEPTGSRGLLPARQPCPSRGLTRDERAT